MALITDTASLNARCTELARAPFVCVDTEFMRERTYWPRLCLVQLAGPEGDAVAVDPLAGGIDLAPLVRLLLDERVTKVFHAARQDIEIFFLMTGRVPAPLFDTQVAGMVCGFGDAASYETLARKLASARIDKSSRYSDWSKRPLARRQLAYALADVAHLPMIYSKLVDQLHATGRASWVAQEMAALADPANYRLDPAEAWRRIKTRNAGPRTLAVLRAIAAVRERWAQQRDLPRQRLVRDEALLEIAATRPDDRDKLARTRGLSSGAANGRLGAELLAAVGQGLAIPDADCPHPAAKSRAARSSGAMVDLLKVLLKQRCEQHGVAHKLVATTADLERIAAGLDDVPALKGWRNDVFGADALKVRAGRLALAVRDDEVALIEASPPVTRDRRRPTR